LPPTVKIKYASDTMFNVNRFMSLGLSPLGCHFGFPKFLTWFILLMFPCILSAFSLCVFLGHQISFCYLFGMIM